ncbi:6-pyruvoyl tetrahydrobiopterin synthase-like [Exaiptasia diaphana]|uniref:6-pyruvoyl tetrahydrobiopterin synthase n=1 Tax=Exaiptasia diaphana TaxID=2652724 RepID=A0A913XUC1_EXADI|nr:6-pyruvoyl tetrahydrobiopterin synthase-like [Exaiptasia diaphana]
MKVCRRETFNAAHRLFREDWSDEKNLEVFGKCSYPNFHGHNYALEVWVDGPVDPETGFVIDLKVLKTIIHEKIVDRFDHQNLNLDCPEFKGINPTTENIAIVIWNILRRELSDTFKIEVHLQETEKNKVVYTGS